jgi:hypothetical protein
MSHPLLTSTDVIRHAIAEHIDDIAFAASYAVMCWGFSAPQSI